MSDDASKYVTFADQSVTLSSQPTVITFMAGNVWALRLSKDGIESNPDVKTDDGAKAIFEALKPYLLSLK